MARRNLTSRFQHSRRRPVGTLPSLVASTLRTPALTRLPPREQEIAAIVYLHTDVTAKDLESALSNEITNSAIRCMLGRLVAKGVLKRRKGPGKTFIYSPALLLPDVQERALERLAEDFFDGSLSQTSHRLLALVSKREPQALGELARQIQAASASEARSLAVGTSRLLG
jgi:predicted transcriptional regulator